MNFKLNLIATTLVVLLVLSNAFGSALTEKEKQITINTLSAIRGLEYDESVLTGVEVPMKCGTRFAMAISELEGTVDGALFKALVERPIRQTYFDSEHFRIHYDTAGSQAPPLDDNILQPGVPDYVDSAALIFEYAWAYELDSLGYADILDYGEPVPDGGAGGNGLYDVYLSDIGDLGYYGLTQWEGNSGDRRNPSFIIIDNDYTDPVFIQLGYAGRPLDALKVTAAHEFFHAIHYSLDRFEAEGLRFWWQEATATWMEDKVFDDVNDYQLIINYFFDYPELSLESFDFGSDPIRAMHPYASCVWPMFLDERFHEDVIKQIWYLCGEVELYNVLPATEVTLATYHNSSFEDAWLEFLIWNYFTDYRADTISKYSEADSWADTLAPAYFYDGDWYEGVPLEISLSGNGTPEQLAANYIVIDKRFVYQQGGLRFTFDGEPVPDTRNVWRNLVLGWDTAEGQYHQIDVNPPENLGEGVFRGWQRFAHIVYIPAVFGFYYQQQSVGYSLTATYDAALSDSSPVFYDLESFIEVKAGDCLNLELYAYDPNGDMLSFRTEPPADSIDGMTLSALSDTSALLEYCPAYIQVDDIIPVNLFVEDPAGHYDIKHIDFKIIYFPLADTSSISIVGYPNPFNYETDEYITLRFSLPDSTIVSEAGLYIFNTAGDLVYSNENLDDDWLAPGETVIIWDGKNDSGKELAAGIYILKIHAGDSSADGKIAIIR